MSNDQQQKQQEDVDSSKIPVAKKDQSPPLFIAFFSMAAGIYPLLLSLDIIPGGSESLNVPVWVGVIASSIFILAGCALLSKNIKWLNQLFGISIVIAFAVIGNWIAFGVGERTCGMQIFAYTEEVSGLMCRIPFGYGAILLNGVLLVLFMSRIIRSYKKTPAGRVIDKINGIIMIIILLPLLIFLVVPIIFKGVKEHLNKS